MDRRDTQSQRSTATVHSPRGACAGKIIGDGMGGFDQPSDAGEQGTAAGCKYRLRMQRLVRFELCKRRGIYERVATGCNRDIVTAKFALVANLREEIHHIAG